VRNSKCSRKSRTEKKREANFKRSERQLWKKKDVSPLNEDETDLRHGINTWEQKPWEGGEGRGSS